MNVTSSAARGWSVSTRPAGEVLTAATPPGELQMVLLGVPAGFTAVEVEGWLADLAGVALETSRADQRARAIPPLLHHALTGLLFSQSELWGSSAQPVPCSLAFVTADDGASFGWVGDAQVRLRVNGQPFEPQWVRVRDDSGREAHAVAFGPGAQVEVDLAWGADASGAPLVALGADWIVSPVAPLDMPAPAAEPPLAAPFVAPAIAAAEAGTPLLREWPAGLPLDQPALQSPLASAVPDEAPPQLFVPEARIETHLPLGEPEPAGAPDAPDPERPHPVQRWLTRMMGWGKKDDMPGPESAAPAHEPQVPPPAHQAPLADSPSPFVSDLPVPGAAPAEAGTTGEPQAPPERWVNPFVAAAEDAAPAPGRPPVWRADDAAGPEDEGPRADEAEPTPGEPVREPTREPEPRRSGTMPVIRTEFLAGTPLAFEITHEPVGAHETFGIPRVPPRDAAEGDEPRSEGPPPLPHASDLGGSGEATLVIESHQGAEREPLRREIASQVTPPAPSAPDLVVGPARGGPPAYWGMPGIRTESPGAQASAAPAAVPAPSPPHTVEIASTPAMAAALAAAAARRAAPPAPIEHVAPTAPLAPPLEPAWLEAPAVPPTAPRRAWPIPEAPEAPRGAWMRRAWPWAALFVVLAAVGWWLGHMDSGTRGAPGWLRAVGLGGARFDVALNTDPPGAWINVDGKDLAQRTPTAIDLPPGEHEVKFSMPDLGSTTTRVKGARGDRLTLDVPLHGSLEIASADPGIALTVALNGRPLGYVPARVDSIAPGLHELTFNGPGLPAWVQTVQVGIGANAQVIARPVTSPNTGMIQVQAVLNEAGEASPLSGAQVYVDGELRGNTPLTLELPRGPHSVRVQWHGVTAPVQVIDLPGGNQRFATFNFGLDETPVALALLGARSIAPNATNVVSAEMAGMHRSELRESWLHVRSAEGVWRRYALTPLDGPEGAVLVGVFPPGAFDASGRTRWYVSAITRQGDEFYSEIQSVSAAPKPAPKPAAAAQP